MSPLAELTRALRTFVHLRPTQAVAQLRHMIAGGVEPVRLSGPPPALAISSEAARHLIPFLPAPRLDNLEEPTESAEGARSEGQRVALTFVNRRVEFDGAVDWEYVKEGPLWTYHLHQCDFLRGAHVGKDLRAQLMLDWIEHHPRGVGWDPHPMSHRILAWGRLLLEPGALALDEASSARVRASLADQIETLSRHLETRLQANHLFTNLAAVVFGGLLFEGARADAWLRLATAFEGQLRGQILADGMHEERSPMYHSLLLEQVLDLVNVTRVVPERAPPGLRAELEVAAARMCGALGVLTHADGEIALFCDSGLGSAPSPGALAGYAGAVGVRPQTSARAGVLEQGGYVKLGAGAGGFELIASVGAPGPAHNPGHAHCDALSFELTAFGERLVTDTGVFEYRPGARREVSRGTASHATACVGGAEQAELWAAHRIGARPRVTLVAVEPGRSAEATCAGFATRDTVHRRRFSCTGEQLVVEDSLEGSQRFVAFALPLAPGAEAVLEAGGGEGERLVVALTSGRVVEVGLPAPDALAWRLARTAYFPEFGIEEERWCLFGEGESFRTGRWVFRVRA